MNGANTQLFGSSIVALRERKRILDAVWLLSLAALFLSLFLPWFFRVIELNLAAVGWTLVVYGGVYSILAIVTDRQRMARAMVAGVVLMQITTVVLLAVIWPLAGGTRNPMFLLAFA